MRELNGRARWVERGGLRWHQLRLDIAAYFNAGVGEITYRQLLLALLHPGTRACIVMRAMMLSNDLKLSPLTHFLHLRLFTNYAIDVVPGAEVGGGVVIRHPAGVVIGRGAVIGEAVTILQGVTLGQRRIDQPNAAYPRIESNVLIGANATLLGAVVVVNGKRVAANSITIGENKW